MPEGASESDVKGCVIYFSVCQSLPYPFNGSSIGQEVTYQNSSTVNFDMGKYNTAMKFEPSASELRSACVRVCVCVCVCGVCVCV